MRHRTVCIGSSICRGLAGLNTLETSCCQRCHPHTLAADTLLNNKNALKAAAEEIACETVFQLQHAAFKSLLARKKITHTITCVHAVLNHWIQGGGGGENINAQHKTRLQRYSKCQSTPNDTRAVPNLKLSTHTKQVARITPAGF
jgi:hypothetical protein